MLKSFGYKVVINDDKKQIYVEEFLNNKKKSCPIYLSPLNYNNLHYDTAQACRAAALNLLMQADGIQHTKDFYHEMDIEEQIRLMMREGKLEI